MADTGCVRRAKTALAEEAGIISAMTEKTIMNAATDYPLRRIKERMYDFGMGENPRRVRMSITPPKDVEYLPFLPSGNEAINVPNPDGSGNISTFGDKQGRGCNIPAERLYTGYDEFGRCLAAKALETEPMCLIDLLQKKSVGAFIRALRRSLPKFGRESFSRSLLRNVEKYAHFKFVIAEGFPVSTGASYYPAVPTGGLNTAFLQRVEDLMRPHGWDEGSESATVNGRPALQVYAGRWAIQFAIVSSRTQKGVVIQSNSTTAVDSTFGQTEVHDGIQFIENPLPPRGYLTAVGAGWVFNEIPPTIVVAAGVEGVKQDENSNYYKAFITVGGSVYPVLEKAYIIHPRAMRREAMAIPSLVEGMKFDKDFFNFEVRLIDDWRVAGAECNQDELWFKFRMLHAYAPAPEEPELMTSILFMAATPQILIINPNAEEPAPTLAQVSNAPLPLPKADSCTKCEDVEDAAMVNQATCEALFPANGVGVIQVAFTAVSVEENVSGVTVAAERVGGNVGAASVTWSTPAGTAVNGVNFTGVSPGSISWLDGEAGRKYITIPILAAAGDDDGKQFKFVLSVPVGATLNAAQDETDITIIDADNA